MKTVLEYEKILRDKNKYLEDCRKFSEKLELMGDGNGLYKVIPRVSYNDNSQLDLDIITRTNAKSISIPLKDIDIVLKMIDDVLTRLKEGRTYEQLKVPQEL